MYPLNAPREFIIPALYPPPGVTPNFRTSESRGSKIIVTSAICLTLMTAFVCMRFYTKIHIKRMVAWDDCEVQLPTKRPLALITQDLCIPAAVSTSQCICKVMVILTDPTKIGAISFAGVSIASVLLC